MARRVVKSDQALADIASIYWRGVELLGETQAEKFHREIYQRFDVLAEHPELGPARGWIRPGLRAYFLPAPVVIVYRFTDDALIVLRVLHGRENYETLLQRE